MKGNRRSPASVPKDVYCTLGAGGRVGQRGQLCFWQSVCFVLLLGSTPPSVVQLFVSFPDDSWVSKLFTEYLLGGRHFGHWWCLQRRKRSRPYLQDAPSGVKTHVGLKQVEHNRDQCPESEQPRGRPTYPCSVASRKISWRK